MNKYNTWTHLFLTKVSSEGSRQRRRRTKKGKTMFLCIHHRAQQKCRTPAMPRFLIHSLSNFDSCIKNNIFLWLPKIFFSNCCHFFFNFLKNFWPTFQSLMVGNLEFIFFLYVQTFWPPKSGWKVIKKKILTTLPAVENTEHKFCATRFW